MLCGFNTPVSIKYAQSRGFLYLLMHLVTTGHRGWTERKLGLAGEYNELEHAPQIGEDATSKKFPGALAAMVGDWQVCSSGCEARLWPHIC